ncbi:hypothetical protein ACFRAQ_36680 [Nocardia sp. NPDC056611]
MCSVATVVVTTLAEVIAGACVAGEVDNAEPEDGNGEQGVAFRSVI